MPKFLLTATHDIHRPQIGLDISRGQQFTININMQGITPCNLFANSRCADALVRQFQINGIDVPKTDIGIYNKGAWNIKIV